MQHEVNSLKASGSQGQQPTVPPPRCEELTPSAGPECTSNRSPKIIGMGADFSLHRCTSSVLTRGFIAVSREGITPDSLLTGRGERVCLHSSQSKKTMLSVHAAQKCPLVSLTIFSGIKVRANKQETVTLTFLCPVFKPFDFRNTA